MRLVLLSDVHGNLQALEAVLVDARTVGFDRCAFLGDAVGYGANPNEAVQVLSENCEIMIMGNHDACVLGAASVEQFNQHAQTALRLTNSTINDESRQILADAKLTDTFEEATLTHATPYMPERWNYCLSIAQAELQFEHFDTQVCFIGHSHFPVIFNQNSSSTSSLLAPDKIELEQEHRYVINVGSVGQPRDGDPRACYACFDTDAMEVSYRRVSYDIASAQDAMRKCNLPDFLIERLTRGR